MARKSWSEMTPEELKKYRENAERTANTMTGIGVGGAGAMAGFVTRMAGGVDNSRFANQMNRANFLNKNWFDFKDVNSELNTEFIKDGEWGVRSVYDNIWNRTIGKGRGWEPADISQSGEFLKNRKTSGLSTILTVTPEPVSQRFASATDLTEGARHGGNSGTLWGNTEVPQYGYARGNLGVGEIESTNPTAQFSAVDLPPSEKTKYKTTGGANQVGASERGWGQAPNKDIHFGKEYRELGGATTANDIYTILQRDGVETPMPTGNAPDDLRTLTEKLAEHYKTDSYNALERAASPTPKFGPPDRNTGQLPTLTHLDTQGSPRKPEAGFGTYFQETPTAEAQRSITLRDEIGTRLPNNSPHGVSWSDRIKETFDNPQGPGNTLARRGLGGLAGTVFTSPEAIRAAREGNYGTAAFITGTSFGAGEVISGGLNALTQQAVKHGMHWAPKAVAGVSRFASPLVAIDALDAVSTAATGKNVRELAVESGNLGPAMVAMSTPQTMAPLGYAGGASQAVGMQATVPNLHPERKEESEYLQSKVEEARERGGRWKVGPVTIPEFGFSEGLDLNNDTKPTKPATKPKPAPPKPEPQPEPNKTTDISNEVEYIGKQVRQGSVPYLNIPTDPRKWFR